MNNLLEILAFESWDKVESIITAILGAVVAILSALTPIIKKWQGKKKVIDVLKDINKQEIDLAMKVVEEQSKIVKEAIKGKEKKDV